MPTSRADIIVPVWNNIFETSACLTSIRTYSPDARLVIINNGGSRETEIMLEEFAEILGENTLILTSGRNIGLVPAINMGLRYSESNFAVIVRPHVTVTENWLDGLLNAAQADDAAIVTPLFSDSSNLLRSRFTKKVQIFETFGITFNTLLLKREFILSENGFSESLDGGEYCLKDMVQRARTKGYRTLSTPMSRVICGVEPFFGSEKRRMALISKAAGLYREKWGAERCYTLYLDSHESADELKLMFALLNENARKGDRFNVLLHRKQFDICAGSGTSPMHTSINLIKLSPFFPVRDMNRQISAIKKAEPSTIFLKTRENAFFPGIETSIPLSAITSRHFSDRGELDD